MKITYDPEADAMYVHIAKQEISHTIPVNDSLLVDVDRDGNAVGIEILDASTQEDLAQSLKESISTRTPVTLLV